MSQLMGQIVGAIIMGLLAFFLLAVSVAGRLGTRGKYSRAHDEELWDTKVRGGWCKGVEVPRYSEPLPVGRVYGDNERGERISKRAVVLLIVLAALVGLAVVYFMPDMSMGVWYLGGESHHMDKVAYAVAICVVGVAAAVYVVASDSHTGRTSKRKQAPEVPYDDPGKPVQHEQREEQRRRRRGKRRTPGSRRV